MKDNSYHQQMKQGSPCKGVCSTTYDITCRGCGRNFEEVANWSVLDEEERLIIWDRIIQQGYFDNE